jgi:hypothetical protein
MRRYRRSDFLCASLLALLCAAPALAQSSDVGTITPERLLSPTDELADYGLWDKGNLDLTVAKKNDMLEYEYARAALKNGLKLEATLGAGPAGVSPRFLVLALRDPIGANLDRIQIVRGWLGKDGKLEEQVRDVAWSGDRSRGSDGKLPPVGNTVDVPNATWTNTIGSSELITVWQDPDFDPADYHARVIEIPTPRWTAYDRRYFAIENVPAEVPMTTQERAYTSPIWCTPPA